MSDVFDELRLQPTLPQRTWKGLIASNPATFADRVDLVIPTLSMDMRWEKCRWNPRNETELPSRGDECLIMFDNDMEPWVVTWWPFS